MGKKKKVAILNVVESGHRVLDAVAPYAARLGVLGPQANLFEGRLSVDEKLLCEAVRRVDALVALWDVDAVVFVATGPAILWYVVLQRSYKLFSLDDLSDILYAPFGRVECG